MDSGSVSFACACGDGTRSVTDVGQVPSCMAVKRNVNAGIGSRRRSRLIVGVGSCSHFWHVCCANDDCSISFQGIHCRIVGICDLIVVDGASLAAANPSFYRLPSPALKARDMIALPKHPLSILILQNERHPYVLLGHILPFTAFSLLQAKKRELGLRCQTEDDTALC